MALRHLELNGGQVVTGEETRLVLPPTAVGYADAQIDDYGPAQDRAQYPWHPGTQLSLRTRFSHGRDHLIGTAGFGFWNAPFGDPTVRRPALPQAAWFFYASAPSDLPFPVDGPGRGWFAATIDAATPAALLTAPLAPAVLLLNQFSKLKNRLWPWVRRRLQISFAPIETSMTRWTEYKLHWRPTGCTFTVNGEIILQTPYSPRGSLGFVCWLDNQYLIATPHGRFRWGTIPTEVTQVLEIADLQLISQSGG
jgi:hypothetical protein